jgi:hypothetical protein
VICCVGEQGGRAIPGQPFGCDQGPGNGGNGGKGGNAEPGGDAGNGGRGGVLTFEVPAELEKRINEALSKQIIVDASGGKPGNNGKAGKPGGQRAPFAPCPTIFS